MESLIVQVLFGAIIGFIGYFCGQIGGKHGNTIANDP